MATARKPIVDLGGYLGEIPSGDVLDAAITDKGVYQAVNANAGAITIGMAVYISAADTVDKARANALGTTKTFGLVAEASIASAATGSIQFEGPLVSSDWTAIIGSTTLTSGQEYYLSDATAGKLTATPPSASGSFVQKIGQAIDTTTLFIRIDPYYKKN